LGPGFLEHLRLPPPQAQRGISPNAICHSTAQRRVTRRSCPQAPLCSDPFG